MNFQEELVERYSVLEENTKKYISVDLSPFKINANTKIDLDKFD